MPDTPAPDTNVPDTPAPDTNAPETPAPNSPPTGAPIISGTGEAGRPLTASTSGIADGDGLLGATFSHQWIAGDGETGADIPGATGVTYTPVTADVGRSVSVRVTFDDDAGNTETLTSGAVVVIAPLTARFTEVPASHFGPGRFTFRIAFSEPIGIGYATLRDHSLEVTGGSVSRARRADGRSDLWEITVAPGSTADVVVALPADRACDIKGAVCTGDGKRLSNRPELTVPGPGA